MITGAVPLDKTKTALVFWEKKNPQFFYPSNNQ